MDLPLVRDIEIEVNGLNPCNLMGGVDTMSYLDAPRVGYSVVDRTQDHGVGISKPFLRNRVFTVEGDIAGRDNIRLWREQIALASRNGATIRLRHPSIGDGTYRLPDCIIANSTMPVDYSHNRDYAVFSLQVVTSSPYYFSDELHVTSTDPGENVPDGATVWPLGTDSVFSGALPGGGFGNAWNLSLFNYGNVATGAKFFLSDGVSDENEVYEYGIYNETTGKSFVINGVIYQTYVIDTDLRVIYKEQTGGPIQALFSGEYFQLEPGENVIKILEQGFVGDDVRLGVEWRSAWA